MTTATGRYLRLPPRYTNAHAGTEYRAGHILSREIEGIAITNWFTRRNFCKAGSAAVVGAVFTDLHSQQLKALSDPRGISAAETEYEEGVDSGDMDSLAMEREAVLAAQALSLASVGNQELVAQGIVDVTSAPFEADPTGKSDATTAIQNAIYFAREKRMVLFFPVGVYRVSDTLKCPHGDYDPVHGKFRGRNLPCVLIGSRTGPARPKILLAPQSHGYGDPTKPKHVIRFWSWSKQGPPVQQDNINMNQMLIGINIVIGEKNPGAVGVRCRGAQGTSIQDCSIDATHGYSGLEGGAGSGGGHYNVSVFGGQIGADLRLSQPASTIAGFTLVGQTKHAIFYDGRQTLTAVGCRIEFAGSGPAIVAGGERPIFSNGQISMVDSSIDLTAKHSAAAFGGSSSLYLNQVFIRGSRILADWGEGHVVGLMTSDWTCVREYAHARKPLPVVQAEQGPYTFCSPIYVNEKTRTNDLLETARMDPPQDLTSRHTWGDDFPSWEDRNAINVKSESYKAVGDGVTDDTAAIQKAIDEHEIVYLPKGDYLVSRTLQLKPHTKLIGLHGCFSRIVTENRGAFTDDTRPAPIVATANDSNASTILAFLGVSVGRSATGAYALRWQAGRTSIYRSAIIEFIRPEGTSKKLNVPLVLITGMGGGRWYNFYQESWQSQGIDYRHLLVAGTSEPLRIYQCNPEHARGAANMEIRGSRHVLIYGLKSEGNQPVLSVVDSSQIHVFGYGGNAAARPGTTLFIFETSRDYLVANLVDSPRFSGGSENFFAGVGVDPRRWCMFEDKTDGSTFTTKPLERPVLVSRS